MKLIIFLIIVIGIVALLWSFKNKKKLLQEKLSRKFPELWRTILKERVAFYAQLDEVERSLFEKRIQYFLMTKSIEGIEIKIDDTIRLMVASSAIIPTFAFPNYNYPYVKTVLIYPNSFDDKFQTQRYNGHKEFITGMIGSNFQNGTVILSQPDLVKAFEGLPHKENVGIHEFVHLLDKEDGDIDGIPQLLLNQAFVGPWLHEIKTK